MENLELYLKNLTGKDELKAQEAASYLIDSADIELFKMLVAKTDFLFDFVRNNVNKRIQKAVNSTNFLNLIDFFEVYSSYYDDLFISILAKNADEELTDKIYDLLENGSESQKTYSAKYFSYIPDTISVELLIKYAFCDDEFLSYNAAEALGKMDDDSGFKIALEHLASDDDLDKLSAVRFFVAYGKNYPLNEILDALKISKIPENIAGQIPYMISLSELLIGRKEDAFIVLDNILSGLGEILPLSEIFQFELFEVLEQLIKMNKNQNEFSGKLSEILLKALAKFKLFCENQEYIFDEDKDTKYEITAILKLLQSQSNEFWFLQKQFVIDELVSSDDRILSVLPIISEFSIKEAIDSIKKLLNSENEIVVCESLSCLKELQALDGIDINLIVERIKNSNIKAYIQNIKA